MPHTGRAWVDKNGLRVVVFHVKRRALLNCGVLFCESGATWHLSTGFDFIDSVLSEMVLQPPRSILFQTLGNKKTQTRHLIPPHNREHQEVNRTSLWTIARGPQVEDRPGTSERTTCSTTVYAIGTTTNRSSAG